MSTTAEIARMPLRSRRCLIHAGVGAVASIPSITRAANRGHAIESSMRNARVASVVTGIDVAAGADSGAPVMAAASRAMPTIDRQSARLGVSCSVRSLSSSSSAWRKSVPGASPSSRRNRPEASSLKPSSRAEHSMPRDSTPRIACRAMIEPPGREAPSSAQGASMPAVALGAPQTICNRSRSPTSTEQTRSRSAFGCAATASIRPTTTRENGGATGSIASTSSPAIVSASASACVDSGGSTYERSQRSENRMRVSSELREKAQIVFEKQSQIVDAVTEHRETIGAHAECEALPRLRIETDGAQHVRVHLTRSGKLQPVTFTERHVDLGGRLGERKERRTKADANVVALEKCVQKLRHHAFEIGERHIAIDPQALDLMEHRRMRCVAVDAIHAAGRDDLDRRRVRFHVADLDRRSLRAQNHAALDVEGVLHRARRMIFRRIECREIVE